MLIQPRLDNASIRILGHKKRKERILIGDEYSIRSRLEGNAKADVFCDITRPLGTFILDFVHDEKGEWSLSGLMPLYNALHTNRWNQPALEQTASKFFSEQFESGDPEKMYAALRIWNEYLKTRMVRDRNTASEGFLRKCSDLIIPFKTELISFYNRSRKVKSYKLTDQSWGQIPMEDLRLDLWYPDKLRSSECVAAYNSFFPLVTYYRNRLNDWGLHLCRCRVCWGIFLADSLRYELCSDKCRKTQALENKRVFDERARENLYDLRYKNERQNWQNKINRAKKTPRFPPEILEQMQAAFTAFKKEALQRKKLVKGNKASLEEFSSWLYPQSRIIDDLADRYSL